MLQFHNTARKATKPAPTNTPMKTCNLLFGTDFNKWDLNQLPIPVSLLSFYSESSETASHGPVIFSQLNLECDTQYVQVTSFLSAKKKHLFTYYKTN